MFRLEQAIIKALETFGVTGHPVGGAPGILREVGRSFGHSVRLEPRDPRDPFKGVGKIAALGIKVSRHCTYHGVALNVAMDLSPYDRINPCGCRGWRLIWPPLG